MSYLVLPEGIDDFSKVTISFWFRVPKESILAAANQQSTPRLSSILPLVVWGPDNITGYVPINGPSTTVGTYNSTFAAVNGDCSWDLFPPAVFGANVRFDIIPGFEFAVSQSFIGLNCTDFGDGTFSANLIAHIQMKDLGTGTSLASVSDVTTGDFVIATQSVPPGCSMPLITLPGIDPVNCTTGSYYPGGEKHVSASIRDFSDVYMRGFGGESFNIGGSDNCNVTADQWHHVLLSFDLSHPISATTTFVSSVRTGCAATDFSGVVTGGTMNTGCRAYLAIDDVNLTGADISRFNTMLNTGGTLLNTSGPNAIATDSAYGVPLITNNAFGGDTHWAGSGVVEIVAVTSTGIGTYSYTPSPVPCKGMPFGIPGTPAAVPNICRVEMAEFQLFNGGVLDTSVEANRRLFITSKGMPAEPPTMIPISTLAIGDPVTWEPGADAPAFLNKGVDPTVIPDGVKALGGIAAVDFTHSALNWIMPLNIGKDKGKFERIGKINPFSPDPQLGK